MWACQNAKIEGRWFFNSLCDVKKDFPNASIVGNGRIVFNIKRNYYRLIAKFEFRLDKVFIRFIGTHKQYDKTKAWEV